MSFLSSSPASSQAHLEVPGPTATPDEVKRFLDRVCNHESTYRRERYSEWLEVILALQSVQWLEHPKGQDPRTCTEWTEATEGDDIPRPVENIILELFDNERSRLSRRRPQAFVRPRRTNDMPSKAGASTGDHILDWTLDRVRWDAVYRDFIINDVSLGTGVLCGEWGLDFRNSVTVGAPGAKRCIADGCDFKLSGNDPAIPIKHVNGMDEGRKMTMLKREDKYGKGKAGEGELITKWHATKCLHCGAPLQDFTPAQGADAVARDAFDRPMGKETALGEAEIRSVSPFNFFVQNEGIGLRPGPMGKRGCPNWYAEDTPEDVDDIASWFDKGDKVTPEDPVTLARSFPLLGEHAASSRGYRGMADRTTYYHHARLRRFVSGPTRKFPKGRLLVLGGREVLWNGDLVSERVDEKTGKVQKIPRVRYSAARFYPKHGEFFGEGQIWANLSPQRRVNMRLSQFVDNAEHNGNDGWLVLKGTQVTGPAWASGLAGRVGEWEPSPEFTDLPPDMRAPKPWEGRLMDPGIWQEMQFVVDRMLSRTGLQDADVGKIAGSAITSGTMLQLAGEQSSQRRETKEHEAIDACKDIWQHSLMIQREFVREKREYWVKGDSGAWEQKEFEGQDLVDSFDLIVDEEPHYNKGAFDREMHIKAAELQVIPLDRPYARREFRKELGIKSNIADAEDTQVADAERKWMAFVRNGLVPTIDPFEDDHGIHFDQYGIGWKDGDGIKAKIDGGWDAVLKVIAGWEKDLAQQRQRQMEFEQAVLSGALEAGIAALQTAQKSGQEVAVELGQDPQSALPAPVDPMTTKLVADFGPESGYVPPPEAIEDHILQIWQQRIAKKQPLDPMAAVQDPEKAQAKDLVLRMKAVTEGHRIISEERKAVAQTGTPVQAAPGGEATVAGTEITAQGAGAQPDAGAVQ